MTTLDTQKESKGKCSLESVYKAQNVLLRRKKGASLLEITFVLLIIVGIIGGALVMASGALSQNTVTQEVQTLNNLAAGATQTKTPRGFGNGAGDGVDLLAGMDLLGVLPKNVTIVSGAAQNSWSGDITVTSSNGGADFTITYTNIPREECVKLVSGVKMGLLRSVGPNNDVDRGILSLDPVSSAEVCGVTAGGAVSGVATVSWSSRNM